MTDNKTSDSTPNMPPILNYRTGSDMHALRKKLGLNQSEFWNHIGITQSGGSRYECGRQIPQPVQLLVHIAYGKEKQAEDLLAWLRMQKPCQ